MTDLHSSQEAEQALARAAEAFGEQHYLGTLTDAQVRPRVQEEIDFLERFAAPAATALL